MRIRGSARRPRRLLVAPSLALALAACKAITGGGDNAFATVKGTVTLQGGAPFANQTVAVVCPVLGRGQFGNSTTTDAAGGYTIDVDAPSSFIDDVKFSNWRMPCDLYSPATNGRAPDTTRTIVFGDTRSAAPVTTVDFISKP